jgi:spiro-SPASM protein
MKKALVLHVNENLSDQDLTFCGKFIPDVLVDRIAGTDSCDVIFSLPETYSGSLSKKTKTVIRNSDDIPLWKKIADLSDAEAFIRVFADAPFLDPSVVEEMFDIHSKYLAEFTYSENLPAGLSCEIYSAELIKALPDSDQKSLPLSQVIRSNINQFDVELYYKAPDIRDKRLSFRVSDRREKKILEGLFNINGSYPDYPSLKGLIEEHCEVLYTGPSYLELELTGESGTETIYSWRKGIRKARGAMDTSDVEKIISGMREFDLPYTVCLGGAGDPLLHPSFYGILDKLTAEPNISSIIIETDGINAGPDFAEYVSAKRSTNIIVIVEMNGNNAETYKAVHGKDEFDKVYSNIMNLKEKLGDNSGNLYIQIMKIKETEPIIDAFYDFWEDRKVQIILQKQNVFLGLIEDRRYYDLTPLDRIPCWHLQRDMFIMSDGSVGFCKQDINGEWSKWNLRSRTIGEIWESKKESFVADYRGKRASCPDCNACDEWYTFNM